ncbi:MULTISPECIES: hypothetical protein [Micrococcus]|uniref:Uncharacterized protein n=2 Tax=Micrococcus TaxID=1269 RepID=A0AAP3EV86_MICLU|nr:MULTISPECIES: hypothetical protein [Micrococcus]AKA20846.1 hypothetical protein pLMA7_p00130 [Micrococcus sp. A7]MCV7454758.1 hypothetical protein [Micrococcus luteus]MCV7629860.1 hypothetical protein [Micrococcus luteus]MCV7631940.1 hypothetical protein [Micrococcus luteus]MCV7636625.1 hypothetical protein [Micrococcus luteus]
MPLNALSRILITPHGSEESFEGTVGGLIRHVRHADPSAITALEQSLHRACRLPDTGDVREASLEHNLAVLTAADLERLEPGATITILDA